MAFKENLFKKIKIDRLSNLVTGSLISKGNIPKVDKDAMKELLDMLSFQHKNERFMDLYIRDSEGGKQEILVLDNELPLYRTTIEDVLLRKDPTLKEMISIRNAIKILNDSDVIISKKDQTIIKIKKECLALLDLNYNEKDIETIKKEGVEGLENWETETVTNTIDMFSELLEFEKMPGPFKIANIIFKGRIKETDGKVIYGPVLMYDTTHNKIKFINEAFDNQNNDKINFIKDTAIGKEKGDLEGEEVFDHLEKLVITDMKPVKI